MTSPRTVQARSCAAERRETSARARSKSPARSATGASSGAPREAHCQRSPSRAIGGSAAARSRNRAANRSRMASRPAVSWPPGRPSAPRRSCSWMITSPSGRIPLARIHSRSGSATDSHSATSAARSWSRRCCTWRSVQAALWSSGSSPPTTSTPRPTMCANRSRTRQSGQAGTRTSACSADSPSTSSITRRWALVHSAMPSTAPISPVPVPATQRSCSPPAGPARSAADRVRSTAADLCRAGPPGLASDRMRAAG